jgi:glycosyltransferase involved in cell wall biosynthesis
MGKQVNLTAVIIAHNEEKKLAGCLESLSWVNELLLVDDASSDKTVEIAKKLGANVISASGKDRGNYARLRNLGMDESKGKWILYVDADERASDALKKEVSDIVRKKSPENCAYAIPRKNIILGREMSHGGWWPDYVKRLFLKSKFNRWSGELHEEPDFEGSMAHLKAPLIHLKHNNLSEMVAKTNKWSEIEAKLMFDAGHPKMNLARFFTAMFREFFLRIVRQKAYLDGTEGMIYAFYQVFSRFISYGKLWEMQIKLDR